MACQSQPTAPVAEPEATRPAEERTSGEVPAPLASLVAGRDSSPLPPDALVRYQLVGLAPSIASNHRFVLYTDGRLHAAANTAEAPTDPDQRFNTPLPDEPTATLPAGTVAEVEQALRALATSPPFVGDERVRDGSVVIVTARVDGTVHEIWYQNTDTPLTDLLSVLYHEHAAGPVSLQAPRAGRA